MRLVLSVISVVLAIASTATGADGAWTERKAASIVRVDGVVRLPAALAAPLVAELEELEYRWLLLEATANQQDLEEGTLGEMGGRAHNGRYRLSTALKQVRGGLPIDEASCVGVGRQRARTFGRFRCAVLSARLEIPTPEAVWNDDRIADVHYGPPQVFGPFRARLDVRVGRAGLAIRQLGESSAGEPVSRP